MNQETMAIDDEKPSSPPPIGEDASESESPLYIKLTPFSTLPPIDVFSLASRWRSGAEWSRIDQEIDPQGPVPLHLVNNSGSSCLVLADGLDGNGAAQANSPAPERRAAYYYEMTVENAGERGRMWIGFMHSFYMGRQATCCVYRGSNGYLYTAENGQGEAEPFGPKFTTGDIVGAGINYASQEFFFTKNGEIVGSARKVIMDPLYPTIAVNSQNEKLTVNFGVKPFLFNFKGYMEERRLHQQARIEKLSLHAHVCDWIVRSYFLHYGYEDTLHSYKIESESMHTLIPNIQNNGFNEQVDIYALSHRKILRQLIMNGEINDAFQKLQEWYTDVLQDTSICFLLHSQRFIEDIQVKNPEDALHYAQVHLARFFSERRFSETLQEIFALLAFDEPLDSCFGDHLRFSRREFVADAVNAVILSTNPDMEDTEDCMQTHLEKLMRQLTLCSWLYRIMNGGQGEAFLLHREELQNQGGKNS